MNQIKNKIYFVTYSLNTGGISEIFHSIRKKICEVLFYFYKRVCYYFRICHQSGKCYIFREQNWFIYLSCMEISTTSKSKFPSYVVVMHVKFIFILKTQLILLENWYIIESKWCNFKIHVVLWIHYYSNFRGFQGYRSTNELQISYQVVIRLWQNQEITYPGKGKFSTINKNWYPRMNESRVLPKLVPVFFI